MLTVETTISLSIPEGADLAEVEGLVAQAAKEAGQQLLLSACQQLEEEVLAKKGWALRREKQRPLELLTPFGWLRLPRWQVLERDSGRYYYPLDSTLGLTPRQHATPLVISQAIALATRLPYRQATYLLQQWVGAFVDHRTVYAWMKQAGAKVVVEEDEEQEAVFGRGEVPPCGVGERELVVAEVDGTFLKAQREGSPDFEIRVGVLFSGKELESATAKHRRYRLKERVLYGGVESASDFGERLFLLGEARLGLTRARNILMVGDGAEWIEHLAGHERWKATYQLDWWHVTNLLHRTFPDRPELVAKLKGALYDGEGERLLHLVGLARVMGVGILERVAHLEGYLRSNQHGLYGARGLREQLSPEAKLVAVEGSGAIEKQMDLMVGRRFKGQGMRWTRKGANWLLKLRVRELDKVA